jgi:hypothetical protein
MTVETREDRSRRSFCETLTFIKWRDAMISRNKHQESLRQRTKMSVLRVLSQTKSHKMGKTVAERAAEPNPNMMKHNKTPNFRIGAGYNKALQTKRAEKQWN